MSQAKIMAEIQQALSQYGSNWQEKKGPVDFFNGHR